MNLQAIFDYARASLDSDSTELTDALLAVWETECEARIISAIGTATRLFSGRDTIVGTGATQAFALTNATEPRVISGPLWELEPLPHNFALQRWPRNAIEGSPVQFGHATHWTIDDKSGKLWLWPAPTTGDSHIVTGLKPPSPTDTSVLTNVPTIPTKYHPLIGEYLVARGYEFQQNAQIASMKMARFEAELDTLQRDDNRPSKVGVTTIGSDQLRKPRTPIGRLSFPWE